MSVTLSSIQFNHLTNSVATDAVNIRRNANTPVLLPEWEAGRSVVPEDSPVCYAMEETRGNTLTIQVDLRSIGGVNRAQVRAIDPNAVRQQRRGCAAVIAGLIVDVTNALVGNALGDVQEKWVNFDQNGQANGELFNLQNVAIWDVGVSARTTTWQWQYRLNANDPWQDMEETQHRVYIILEAPKAPWSTVLNDPSNPWTEVLDVVCTRAYLSKDRDTAASKITDYIFHLGNSVITYDCPGGGSTNYARFGNFNCTKFLERINGGVGLGQYVNCTDCATIVTSFSNILGCELWSSRMGRSRGWQGNSFLLNSILAIGSNVWQTACGWNGFSYHEVAWKDACTENDHVFDACLKVDGTNDPENPPHTPDLVANMLFGDCNAIHYRRRLSPNAPGGCVNCTPQPQDRIRRPIV